MSGDPYWSDVQLLLHFDGANGSTTFTDSSQNNFYVTGNGGSPATSLETSNVLYGTASANFGNGAPYPTQSAMSPGDGTTLSAAPQLNPGTGDFTVECWINTTNFSNSLFGIIGNLAATAPAGFGIQLIGGPLAQYYWYDDSGTQHYREIGVPYGSWAHIAFVRYSGNITCYVNGVASYSDAYSGNFNLASYLSTALLVIGWAQQGLYQFGGLMDEFRYTVGVARYTANFTPPTGPFPTGPASDTVPNVIGDTQSVATTAIITAGLVVGTVSSLQNPATAGTVIAQSPTAGTGVSPGSAVNLLLSLGENPSGTIYLGAKYVPAKVGAAIMAANPGNIHPRITPPERDTTLRIDPSWRHS